MTLEVGRGLTRCDCCAQDELAALNGRRTRVDEGGGRGLFGKLDEVDALEVRDTEGAVQIRFGDEGSQLGSEYEII